MGEKQNKVKKNLNFLFPDTLIRALKVLSKTQQRKIFTVALIQSSLSVLDLAGVAAVGLVGALAVTGVQSKAPGNRVGQILEFLNLENTSLQKQVAILGLVAGYFAAWWGVDQATALGVLNFVIIMIVVAFYLRATKATRTEV
jgi:hypothetical protein